MKKSERIELATLITGMAELFDKRLSEAAITIYIRALENHPIDKIRAGINNIVTQRVYSKFPMPGEFLEYINPSHNLEAQAMIAVEKVLDTNEIQGGTVTVSFDDKTIHHTILRLGGWVKVAGKIREIAFTNPKEMAFWKKDFIRMYCFMAKQTDLPGPPAKLLGSMDADNIAKGYLDDNTGQLKLPDGSSKIIDIGQDENIITLLTEENR